MKVRTQKQQITVGSGGTRNGGSRAAVARNQGQSIETLERKLEETFRHLADRCDQTGDFRFSVPVALSACELLGLARISKRQKVTMRQAFAKLLDLHDFDTARDFCANYRG
jgi:hypothetical protein